MGANLGSLCFLRLARYPIIASLMLARASARVFPCEIQPGSEGHSATNTPSSSASITTSVGFCQKGDGMNYAQRHLLLLRAVDEL